MSFGAAGFAVTVAIPVKGVGVVIWVTLWTVGFILVERTAIRRVVATSAILTMCYCFKVIWVDAVVNSAEMVEC